MGDVKSITAAVSLALADRVFAAKPADEVVEGQKEDLAVYGEVKYNIENDGNIHIVIPQRVPLAKLQQRVGAKRAAYFEVKAESVDLVITRPGATEGEEEDTTLQTVPVEFDLRLKFKD